MFGVVLTAAKDVVANLRASSHVDDQDVENVVEDEGPGNIQVNYSVDQNHVLVLQNILHLLAIAARLFACRVYNC